MLKLKQVCLYTFTILFFSTGGIQACGETVDKSPTPPETQAILPTPTGLTATATQATVPSPSPGAVKPFNPTAGGSRLALTYGWQMQSSFKDKHTGEENSTPGFTAQGWYPIQMPASVIAGLLQNGVYPDPFYGKNLELIQSKDFNVPWWYRAEFSLPEGEKGQRVWLRLEGINYRADLWLNGALLADKQTLAGPFRTFELDITDKVRFDAPNALAFEVFRPQRPKEAGGDLAITFVDWNPDPPDENMGILNEVVVSTSGAVTVRHPLVSTRLDLPSLEVAHLTVVAEVKNGSQHAVEGVLRGAIDQVTFSQTVSLAAGESRTVTFKPADFPQLNLSHPDLWWPWQYGNPTLKTLKLEFMVDGIVTDALEEPFGMRTISSEIRQGSRVFIVNGKPILIRGAAWTPDLFQRRSPERQENEFLYIRNLNLNAIRSEGKFEDGHFFDLADKYGILVMIGWCCCDSWQYPQDWSEAQRLIAMESLRSQILRLRSHPSLFVWLNGSDQPPADPTVEEDYLTVEHETQWPNPIVSNATGQASSVSGDSGLKMKGPYEWVPPIYWETDSDYGGAWNFATEISPGPAVPPYDSLVQMIPPEHLWPLDDFWYYHAGRGDFNNLTIFTAALYQRYGKATSAQDYAQKAQMQAYEAHRAMFEAYGRKKYTATGVIQWMLNNAWPGMIWHLYDYYLRPGGSYYGAKIALEPLHIQYSYADGAIVVVNSTLNEYSGLKASMEIYHLDGSRLSQNIVDLPPIPADGVVQAFRLPELLNLPPTTILRLDLLDADDQLRSRNTYWLSTKKDTLNWDASTWYYTPQEEYADFTALQDLPAPRLTWKDKRMPHNGRIEHSVFVANIGSSIAFGVHVKITRGEGGEELLPILWSDNYFILLPGESREVSASYLMTDLLGTSPVVVVESW